MYVIIGSIVVSTIVVVMLLFFKKEVSANHIVFTNVQVTEEKITVDGTIIESAVVYQDHVYFIENNTLYITVRSGLIGRKNRPSDFSINIDNSAQINAIYYIANNKETKIF